MAVIVVIMVKLEVYNDSDCGNYGKTWVYNDSDCGTGNYGKSWVYNDSDCGNYGKSWGL